jgi:hypothetical protein
MSLCMWGMTRGLAEFRDRALQIITVSTAFEFLGTEKGHPIIENVFLTI